MDSLLQKNTRYLPRNGPFLILSYSSLRSIVFHRFLSTELTLSLDARSQVLDLVGDFVYFGCRRNEIASLLTRFRRPCLGES